MRYSEIIQEAKIGQAARGVADTASKVGREFQHIEDLVYIEGVAGVKRALDRLQQIASNSKPLELKVDGSPAIVFGRDESGQFHFGDKYSKGMLTSAKAVYDYYTRSSQTEGRKVFANEMAELFPIYEAATPQNFRGFLEAGLMYKTTPPINKAGQYYFMPNTVEYSVDKNSELGKRIGQSVSGAWATGFFDALPEAGGKRSPVGDTYKAFNNTRALVIIPPKFTEQGTPVDVERLRTISRYAASNANQIEQFLAPEPGMSDIRSIIYSYVNSQVDNPQNLDKLGHNFAQWVESSTKLSPAKKLKITQRLTDNARGASAVFKLTQAIMHVKDGIIGTSEKSTLADLGITARMKTGEPGGEGFVHDPDAGSGPTKLVNRGTFTRANRLRENNTESKYVIIDPTGERTKDQSIYQSRMNVDPSRYVDDFKQSTYVYPYYKAAKKEADKQNKKVVKSAGGKWKIVDRNDSSPEVFNEDSTDSRTAVVGWGRGMGHSGHMLLAQAVIEYAAAIGGTPFFFVSETQGEDDPLTPGEKLSIYKKVFPKHKNIFKTSNTITAVVGDIHEAGYTRMVLVVGEDQKKSFGFLSRGAVSPDRIPVTVTSRQDVAKKLGNDALAAEGPRATPLRNILKGDATTDQKFQAWREAMPNALTDAQVMKVMKLAAARMQVAIEDKLKEADQPPQGSIFSPLSAVTRDRPAPDPRAAIKRKRAEASMQRFMGRRD